MVEFNTTRDEFDLIIMICQRAEASGWSGERMTTAMDLAACHSNGCPLDFQSMANGKSVDLMHDIVGIARHIDRETGKLTDCFAPRFAKPEAAAA